MIEFIKVVIQAATFMILFAEIPYMIYALLHRSRNEKIINTKKNKKAFYYPSLFVTTYMTIIFLIALASVLVAELLPVFIVNQELIVLGEELWVIMLDTISALFIVVAFAMPATFLLWVKKQIMLYQYSEESKNID